MTTTSLPKTIKNVPVEIAFPKDRPHVCHGLTLVHGCDGQPRNYLHEVSCESGSQAEEWAHDFGYQCRCGYRNQNGRQMWTYTKEYDLQVAGWVM